MIGIPKAINFSSGTNEKLMDLGIPILKHIRVQLLQTRETKKYHIRILTGISFMLFNEL